VNRKTFLSLSLGSWSLSLSLHLLAASAVLALGRSRTLDLTAVDLDFSAPPRPASSSPGRSVPEEVWRKPWVRAPHVPRPIPKLAEIPAPAAAPNPAPEAPPEAGSGAGFRSAAQVGQLPRFKTEVKAAYPEAAKRANIEGVVILQVDIDAAGNVKMVDLVQGLGYGCDEAALEAMRQSSFLPALGSAGEPVPVRVRIPYRFKFEY